MTKQSKDSINLPKSLEGLTAGQLVKGVNQEGNPLTEKQKAELGDYLSRFLKLYDERFKNHSADIRMLANYFDECNTRAKDIFCYFNSDLNILDFNEKLEAIQNGKSMDACTLSYLAQLIEEKGISEAARKRTKSLSNSVKNARAKTPKGLAKEEITKIYAERKSRFKSYGYTSEFCIEMLEKFPVIKCIKTIERLVAKLNKKNDLIPR